MGPITIRKALSTEIAELQKIGRQTFFETFSDSNSPQNMEKYLEERFSIGKLSSELADKNSQFFFAELDNQVIGYLKVNAGSSQTELQNEKSLEIERIYVLKEFQGRKVGQLLFDKALKVAEQQNAEFIWLGVWEKNIKAINFYKKNGFIEFDKHIFRLGDARQTDLLMKLPLGKRQNRF